MKKIITTAFVLSTMVSYAQTNEHYGRVGINTITPKASLEVRKHTNISEQSPQGVLFPKLTNAERNKFEKTEPGTLIYNLDKKCIEMYMGLVGGIPQWNCIPDTGSSQQQNVTIVPMGFEGAYIDGVALNNTNKVKFKIINNSFSPINNIDFSTAVSISNNSGNVSVLPNQNRNISLVSGQEIILSYTLSGMPENGLLEAHFERLSLQSSQSTQVGMGSADIAQTTKKLVRVSLMHKGFNVQGKINNTSHPLTIKIPYTNGRGSYREVNAATNTISTAGHNGDINPLTLNIPAGTFNNSGSLNATISVGGDQEYLIKLLQPEEVITLAEFPVDINGNNYTVILEATGGVPDKMFGELTNGRHEHQFIYVPVEVPGDGVWLNNNLGADYANVASPHYSPTTQAGGDSDIPNVIKTDYKAYGSFFQWGRDADGHELNNWTSSNRYTRKNPTMNYMSSPQLPTTYVEVCPNGYHTPTYQELMKLQDVLTGKTTPFNTDTYSSAFWNDLILRLPAAGNVGAEGAKNISENGRYRSSSLVNGIVPYLWFSSRGSDVDTGAVRADLFTIRCKKN